MKQRILSALKHFALSATLRRLPQRTMRAGFDAPQPLRQPSDLPSPQTDDVWMFEKAAANAVEHRMDMLSNEMDRLSGTLDGLRAFLGSVASDAPMLAAYEVVPRAAPMILDRDLFEGEPLSVSTHAIPAAGELGYLFNEETLAPGHIAQAELQARAA